MATPLMDQLKTEQEQAAAEEVKRRRQANVDRAERIATERRLRLSFQFARAKSDLRLMETIAKSLLDLSAPLREVLDVVLHPTANSVTRGLVVHDRIKDTKAEIERLDQELSS